MTVLALEEPEAHLHPQAQRAVFDLACSIPGQRILSTHSPYVTSIADVFDFRIFRRAGSSSRVLWAEREAGGKPTFNAEELEKVQRFVQRRHGEVLFARLVLFVEGETEECAIPVFAERYWGRSIHDKGISLVNAEGAEKYKHYIVLLDKLEIPWLILSDGDLGGMGGIANLAKAIGRKLDASCREVVMLPRGRAFEDYLLSEGFLPQIKRTIEVTCGASALDEYKRLNDSQPKKRGITRDYQSPGWEGRLVLDFMLSNKAMLGGAIAEAICAEPDSGAGPGLPAKVLELFRRVDTILDGEV